MITTARSRHRAVSTMLALTLVALVSMLSMPTAQARELRFRDATRDVVSIDFADAELTPVADPDRSNGDIKSVFAHYRTGRLVVRTNFVALTPARNILLEYSGVLRTNEHRRWAFDVMTSPGRYAGHDVLVTGHGRRACEIGHFLDYHRDFARVSIPLTCLSNPRWVQLSMGAISYSFDMQALVSGQLKPGDLVAHIDDANSDSIDRTTWTPRIRRG